MKKLNLSFVFIYTNVMKNRNVFDFHIHIYKHVFFLCSSSNRRGVCISDYYIPIVAFVEKKKKKNERKNRKPSRTYINMLYNDLSVL